MKENKIPTSKVKFMLTDENRWDKWENINKSILKIQKENLTLK